jgi:very-long-chain (3R)-3-hydroxyacyl-CoA dehydratase
MSTATNTYLQLYNGISALLWFVVLSRAALLALLVGPSHVYGGVGEWTRNVQTMAVLEVVHAAVGLVRSSVATTALQVISRIIIVWAVCDRYPNLVPISPAYTTMLLAWSLTEVVRYTYFVFVLRNNGGSGTGTGTGTGTGAGGKGSGKSGGSGGSGSGISGVPDLLVWLRYSMFYALYPLGIASECWLVWRSRIPAKMEDERAAWVVAGVLALYVPGSVVLYNHMRRQRARVLRGRRKPM